jgi:hypothetical protein
LSAPMGEAKAPGGERNQVCAIPTENSNT